jgi:hypothetical protein
MGHLMRPMPRSQVVLSDTEAADLVRARVAEEMAGQPAEWIAEAAEQAAAQELRERADIERWQQRSYDLHPPVPSNPFTPV